MENKKTILYLVTQTELGGAQRYILDLSENLKNKFKITVGFGKPEKNQELLDELTKKNIDNVIIPHLIRAISPVNDLLAFLEIVKLIKKIKPDIIHLNSSKISILGSIASGFASFAYNSRHSHYIIYTVHGWVFNEPLPKWKKLFYKYAEKITARWKDKIICVAEFDRQLAIKEKIAPENKLITIHNGVSPINFLTKSDALNQLSQIKPITQPADKNILIGAIGNLYKTKGYEYLIEAVNILVARYGLCVTCIIIGEGEERKNLEKLIKKLKLENNFFLLGEIKNAAQFLSAFDIYVCSSVKEGLPYSIIEAMQAGLPVIATDVGGNPELIKNQTDGILVPAKNPEKLAEEIITLINNPNIRENLGKSTRQKALKNFTLQRMIEETEKLYS
jgi:glycosyltransferase involved in cell wall biosynthesis